VIAVYAGPPPELPTRWAIPPEDLFEHETGGFCENPVLGDLHHRTPPQDGCGGGWILHFTVAKLNWVLVLGQSAPKE
jgi:hypothetical protein